MIDSLDDLAPRVDCWNARHEIDAPAFADVRRRMVLDGCKWDPQVGDISTLAPFPLILPADVVETLGILAERLAAEAVAAELAISDSPCVLSELGLPRSVRHALSDSAEPTPAAARVIRFDFHPTAEGWRISEANSDVPGGYTESSLFPRLVARLIPGTRPVGDPAQVLADAVVSSIGRQGTVGLLSASGYMEDHQVVAFLSQSLEERGCATVRAHPRQVAWDRGFARLSDARGAAIAPDVVVRFFQGEWLTHLPVKQGWPSFFRGGRTPVCNPGTALAIESKRFPLTWDCLGLEVPTWRKLLPATVDPRHLGWRPGPGWVLKPAYGNTGDSVAFSNDADQARWRHAILFARIHPGQWVAQRRFETLAISTPRGPMYPCLGVYIINGRAAGIYARLASGPLIDFNATDVAVLVDDAA